MNYFVITDHNSHEYFVSKLSGNFTSDCEILGCCVSVVAPYDTCDVQFTKDPLYKNISSNFTVLFDKPFMIPELSPNTTYFFELSVQVNSSLVISDRLQVTTQKSKPKQKYSYIIIYTFVCRSMYCSADCCWHYFGNSDVVSHTNLLRWYSSCCVLLLLQASKSDQA